VADTITDNRTPVDVADLNTNFVDLTGAAAGTEDSEIKIQGAGSIGQYTTTTRDGLLYNAGTAQSWADQTFYIWINCGVVGLLETIENGGLTIRFCGATVTDWYEVYVGGSNSWPTSVSGGWTQFVVDTTTARAVAVTNGWTNGTVPATTAIQYVGYSAITAATMPRMVDNTWVDEIRRLPTATPGILVQGRNGGSTDWTFSDIITELGVSVGTAKLGAGGSTVLNTPIQFGFDDTVTHGFTDVNATVLWEDWEFVPDSYYGFSALGNSGGTTNVTLGIKAGSGDDATGAQGGSITSAAGGPRFALDFDDANLDSIGFYGVSMAHGADFQLDTTSVEFISCIINDVNSATVTNSLQLRNTIVAANTADDVAFMITDDIGDIKFCSFTFSDGHAIELTTPRVASQTSKGNRFTGYGITTSTDAAIFNDSGGAVDISATVGSSVSEHTYKDGSGASTTVTAAITVSMSNFEVGTEIRVYITSTGVEEDGIETTVADPWDAALQSGINYDIVAILPGFIPIRFESQSFTGDATFNLNQQVDRNFENN
jgi:hypothetical protein